MQNHIRSGPTGTLFLRPQLIYNIYMLKPIVLLCIANLFMTVAWYGHLKFKNASLWFIIVVSWAIAFIEYCFQVPANRIGHQYFTVTQLKVMQEVITLVVFAGFSAVYFKESFKSERAEPIFELMGESWQESSCHSTNEE